MTSVPEHPVTCIPATVSFTLQGSSRSESSSSGSHHLLVVEDNPAVLNATRLLLERHGYRVSIASGLDQAIDEAVRCRDIDLLITDLHLGSTLGTDVIQLVTDIVGRPLKTLMITGDISLAARKIRGCNGVRVLEKPFHAEDLLRMIREVLGA